MNRNHLLLLLFLFLLLFLLMLIYVLLAIQQDPFGFWEEHISLKLKRFSQNPQGICRKVKSREKERKKQIRGAKAEGESSSTDIYIVFCFLFS